jgi:lipopolysaccharide export LptBFGC system permease protein LptF
MEVLKEFLQTIPFIYRYLLRRFLEVFSIILLGFVVLISLTASVLFLNFSKKFQWNILFEYLIGVVGFIFPLIFPLLLFGAIILTLLLLIRQRINWLIFSMGISARNFAFPILLFSLFFPLILWLYCEFLYPKAAYKRYEAYLLSKNKVIKRGIVENFWYKKGENKFIYFSLINLKENKAFDGKIIKLNDKFQIKEIDVIPIADFFVKNRKIVVKADNSLAYTFKRVKTISHINEYLPYDPKLLKVKQPKYFSNTELIRIVLYAKRFGLNFYPFLWELIKRFLLLIFTFLVAFISFLRLFNSVNLGEFGWGVGKLFTGIAIFYILVSTFEGLVDKASVNPLWGLLIPIPYFVWAFVVYKKS